MNGYTEDEYGAYVKKVISEMSREELRVLRNTIYALYGYEFKDEGLREYFEKQVWYEGKGEVRSEGLELPDERQRLLELIQEEEGKR